MSKTFLPRCIRQDFSPIFPVMNFLEGKATPARVKLKPTLGHGNKNLKQTLHSTPQKESYPQKCVIYYLSKKIKTLFFQSDNYHLK
jgi:hypothetical protein